MPAIRTTDQTTEWLIRQLLIDLGEDPDRPGLAETPARVVRALRELLSTTDKAELFETVRMDRLKALFKTFDDECDEVVVVKDIEFVSLCEHHLLPFQGRVHVGYLPAGKVLGLSKFGRVVDYYARQLQIQERLTRQVADAIQSHLRPRGVGVVVEAEHLCMKVRGVRKQDSRMVTSSLHGCFRDDPTTRREFFDLINGRRS